MSLTDIDMDFFFSHPQTLGEMVMDTTFMPGTLTFRKEVRDTMLAHSPLGAAGELPPTLAKVIPNCQSDLINIWEAPEFFLMSVLHRRRAELYVCFKADEVILHTQFLDDSPVPMTLQWRFK